MGPCGLVPLEAPDEPPEELVVPEEPPEELVAPPELLDSPTLTWLKLPSLFGSVSLQAKAETVKPRSEMMARVRIHSHYALGAPTTERPWSTLRGRHNGKNCGKLPHEGP